MANINEKIILQDQASTTLKKVANEAKKTSSVFDKMNKKLTFNDPKLSQGFKDLGSKFDGLKNKFSTEFPKFAQSFGGMGGIVGDIAKINPAITAAVAAIGVYAGAMKGYFALTNEYVNAFTEAMQGESSLALASYTSLPKSNNPPKPTAPNRLPNEPECLPPNNFSYHFCFFFLEKSACL